MADQLTELFRSRFTGHEMDAPADAWAHISSQLAADGGEGLRQALRQKFNGHEVPVDPAAWAHISGQLGHAGIMGSGLGAGWIAAVAAAVALTAGIFLWNGNTGDDQAPAQPKVEVPQATAPATKTVTPAEEAEKPAKVVAEISEPPQAVNQEPRPQTSAVAAGDKEVKKAEERRSAADVKEAKAVKPAAPESQPTPAAPEVAPASPAQALAVGNQISGQAADHQAGRKATEERPPVTPETSVGNTSTTTTTGNNLPSTDPFAASESRRKVFIPNVFSPQGDGINDKLEIVAGDFDRADVKVFSTKTGALVFHTNDLGIQWDGRLPNGNNADEGYYRCVVRLTYANGQSLTETEVVRLYR